MTPLPVHQFTGVGRHRAVGWFLSTIAQDLAYD